MEGFDFSELAVRLAGRDVIGVVIRPENVTCAAKVARLAREAVPEAILIGYGELAALLPATVCREAGFDAAVVSHDPEAALFVVCAGDRTLARIPGLACEGNNFVPPMPEPLAPGRWGFPIGRHLDPDFVAAFSGKRQLTLTAGRGCPVRCGFCSATLSFGAADRRRPAGGVAQFMARHSQFDQFKLFCPDIAADRRWILQFSVAVEANGYCPNWSGTASVRSLQDDWLAEWLALSGCRQLAVGVEGLRASGGVFFRKCLSQDAVRRCGAVLCRAGIEAKALVMLGLPGQTLEDIHYTYAQLRSWGYSRIRPTAYSPYDHLGGCLALEEIEQFDRRTYLGPWSSLDRAVVHELITSTAD